jgi:hypothetical protein
MDTIIIWILIFFVAVYMAVRKFKLNDMEFFIALLLLAIALSLARKQTEHFSESLIVGMHEVFALPSYVKNVVGGSLNKLIEDSKSKEEPTDEEVYSKDKVNRDDDVLDDKKEHVDNDKYRLFQREYLAANVFLLKVKDQFPDAYKRITAKPVIVEEP